MSESDSVQDELAKTWIVFAVLLLLASISKYLSRLLFAIITGVKFGDRIYNYAKLSQYWLQRPLTFLFAILFIQQAFNWLFSQYECPFDDPDCDHKIHENIKAAIEGAISIVRFCFLVYLLFNSLKLISAIAQYEMKENNVPVETRDACTETITTGILVAFFFLTLAVVDAMLRDFNIEFSLLNLFTRINLISATIVFTLVPWMRDSIAGLAILTAMPFQVGDTIEIHKLSSKARLIGLHLRYVDILSDDNSRKSIPNNLLLKHPIINYSENKRNSQILNVSIALHKDTKTLDLRNLISDLEIKLFSQLRKQDRMQTSSGDTFKSTLNLLKGTPEDPEMDQSSTINGSSTPTTSNVPVDPSDASIELDGLESNNEDSFNVASKTYRNFDGVQNRIQVSDEHVLQEEFNKLMKTKTFYFRSSIVSARSYLLVDSNMVMHIRVPFSGYPHYSDPTFRVEKSRLLLLLIEYFELHNIRVMQQQPIRM